jgi:hypothetical protein
MGMHKPQIRIVNHDHIALITWFGTHIIILHFLAQSHKKTYKATCLGCKGHSQAQRKTLEG